MRKSLHQCRYINGQCYLLDNEDPTITHGLNIMEEVFDNWYLTYLFLYASAQFLLSSWIHN